MPAGPSRRLPSQLTLADVLGVAEVTDGGWPTGGAGGPPAPAEPVAEPVAVVGHGQHGPHVIDLVRDGPHVLVGGTTGSGKSEFLRTLVTSLATSAPPEELTFVLVDFKGGAAFGACAALPHVVGLVTDLDDHLVTACPDVAARRAAPAGAALRRRWVPATSRPTGGQADPDGEPVPRLVVVVDELRALVDELPEFVTGLVRLAALGRSLGVHLVLATQRPAGAP